MPTVIWDVRSKGIKPEKLRELEERIGYKLSAEYCEFLLSQNGGIPKFKTFHVKAYRGPHGELMQFFAVSDSLATVKLEKNAKVKTVSTILHEHPHLPRNLLPIAEDAYNNVVALCLEGVKAGRIELIVDPRSKRSDAIKTFALASSFTDFLNNFSHGVYTEILGGKKLVYKLEALNERVDTVILHLCGQFGATATISAPKTLISLTISAHSYDELLQLLASELNLNLERKPDGSWVFSARES